MGFFVGFLGAFMEFGILKERNYHRGINGRYE